ncbi:MAG: triose-phosphate isomerase [candidate division Zixibacteria bacterium]|nr:triose-phosphate isomerase [candidate division Zixibacteria bacterium]
MRQMIVAGNWKMNGTIDETESLINDLLAGNSKNDKVKVVVCPPYTALLTASKLLDGSHISLGAQDMSEHEKGAFTGEISPRMLLTVGAGFVILGHSERRQYHAETDKLVNAKVKLALSTGLTPIICVGELLSEREEGLTEVVVGAQVAGTLSGLTAADLKRVVIAYEPVWAIGTGKTATPKMAQEVHAFIREKLAVIDKAAAEVVPILYGGSVKPDNAERLHRQPDIDGSLVGGASLKADDFIAIINAV